MKDTDVIIIGAGAAGLVAARNLLEADKNVLILEARSRPGGRIHTSKPDGFSVRIEAGAEFIHGDADLTKQLLNEFNIRCYPDEGEIYRIKNGKIEQAENFIKDFPTLLEKVNALNEDMTFSVFMEKYLNEERYKELRETVTRFIEGYDAADINEISTFALREEWKNESASNSFRIEGGYGKLVNNIVDELLKKGCRLNPSSVVSEINYKEKYVVVLTATGKKFSADKVLVTIPLGVLLSQAGNEGYINFKPDFPEKREALKFIGYGSVIKVFFEFKESFWKKEIAGKMPDAGFIFSDTPFTAWWTQLPVEVPLLTGWLSGPNINKLEEHSNEFILSKALDSLAYIFNTDKDILKENIKAQESFNWKNDPYSKGAYAYAKPGTDDAIKKITEPAEGKIFFAGEALYKSDSMGTVEAAIQSGKEAAQKILSM